VIPYFDSLVAKFNASQKSVSVTHDSASSLIAEFVRGNPPDIVDVAHELAKNLTEPLESLPVQGDITDGSLPPGSHPLWDRDEVHDIYAEWRHVFNEYDPPRSAVAEAWVHPSRRPRYASPDGLGQAFNFDLLNANWSSGEFLRVITDNLSDAQRQGSSSTWVLSNHDIIRHATRYGLPAETSAAILTPGRG
jgi:alpha-glucosidase